MTNNNAPSKQNIFGNRKQLIVLLMVVIVICGAFMVTAYKNNVSNTKIEQTENINKENEHKRQLLLTELRTLNNKYQAKNDEAQLYLKTATSYCQARSDNYGVGYVAAEAGCVENTSKANETIAEAKSIKADIDNIQEKLDNKLY